MLSFDTHLYKTLKMGWDGDRWRSWGRNEIGTAFTATGGRSLISVPAQTFILHHANYCIDCFQQSTILC